MNFKNCIGFLGGGQLARMSAFQAYKLGFSVAVFENQGNSPLGQLTKKEFIGDLHNDTLLEKFADVCDVITLENEFIDNERIAFIEALGKKVVPSSKTISLIQDKLIQKQTLRKAGIPVANFVQVNNKDSYKDISSKIGKRFVLKSRKLGYDGYGNREVRSEKQFEEAITQLSNRHENLFSEEYIRFTDELAIMIVRTSKEIIDYTVVKTIQKNHICHIVQAPALIGSKHKKQAKEISISAIESIEGYGIFGVELFLTHDGNLLLNEIAPRPHNSGHYSIEGCVTSQFENHVRSAYDLPLGSAAMVKPYAVMINILGKRTGSEFYKDYKIALKHKDIHLHIYGKQESRLGRKMGHITLLGDDLSILNTAKKIEKKIII